ncbi:MAG: hypothetical protein Q4G35_13760, partial [Propionibacteriaceae bacterium]|nr:hypothetical protein [Propionibacteriaceae bacterium]
MSKGIGRFVRAEAEAAYARTYEDARALWPAHEVHRVDTTYGTAQALTLGGGDQTPVVLLHGLSCTALMWRPNVEALAVDRPVIALDCLADCGGGKQTAPIPNLPALADSVVQTLAGLG